MQAGDATPIQTKKPACRIKKSWLSARILTLLSLGGNAT